MIRWCLLSCDRVLLALRLSCSHTLLLSCHRVVLALRLPFNMGAQALALLRGESGRQAVTLEPLEPLEPLELQRQALAVGGTAHGFISKRSMSGWGGLWRQRTH